MVETTVKKIDRKYGVDIPAVEGGGPCVTVAPIVEGMLRKIFQAGEFDWYLEHSLCKVDDDVDVERLRDACLQVIDRHESLRTCYELNESEGQFYAVVTPVGRCNEDFETIEFVGSDVELKGFLQTLASQPMDLNQSPLLRARVVRHKKQHQGGEILIGTYVLLQTSHVACDGISGSIIMNDIGDLYRGVSLTPLEFHYSQFAEWQTQVASSDAFTERISSCMKYWRENLHEAPQRLNLLLDVTRPRYFEGNAGIVYMEIKHDVEQALRKKSKETYQFPWMYAFLAYFYTLRAYSGDEDIIVMLPRSVRLPEFAEVVGHYANFVTIRMKGPEIDSKSVIEALLELGRIVFNAYANGDVMFHDLCHMLGCKINPSYPPLSQCCFSPLPEDAMVLNLDGRSHENAWGMISKPKSPLDLELFFLTSDDSFKMGMVYNTDVFSEETVHQMCSTMQRFLEESITNEALIKEFECFRLLKSREFWRERVQGMLRQSKGDPETNIMDSHRKRMEVDDLCELSVGFDLSLDGYSPLYSLIASLIVSTRLSLPDCRCALAINQATGVGENSMQLVNMNMLFDETDSSEALIHKVWEYINAGRPYSIFSFGQLGQIVKDTLQHFDPDVFIYVSNVSEENLPSAIDIYLQLDDDGSVIVRYNKEKIQETMVHRICEACRRVAAYLCDEDALIFDFIRAERSEEYAAARVSSAIGTICEDRMIGHLVHEKFEQMAAEQPDKTCLVFENETLSYGEVNEKADKLASRLVYHGLERGSLVGILLERSFDLIVGLLGVLKAGCGYVPLDPGYPKERLEIYCQDSGVSLILVQRHNLDLGKSIASDQIIMEELSDEFSPRKHEIDVTADDTSLVLFTSGSTGRPKGVHHNHRHLREVIMGTVDYFGLSDEDVILLTNTICFDVHMLQIYSPLMVGATLVIAKQDGHLDGDYIASKIIEHSVTGLIFTVPSLAREYMRSALFKEPYHLMKHWGMGGDKVTCDIVAQMQKVFPCINGPVNSYGPTEANVVTQYRFPGNPEVSLIGVPDDNVHICCVDSDFNLVPWGAPGELLISGPRIAMGYYKSPDLTQEKFVRNPAFDYLKSSVPESMWDWFKLSYRTGDLVKFRNCGNLECLGRIDRQIKVNGVRIEVEEIELALKKTDGVEDAVVCLVNNRQGSKILAGYVQPSNVDVAAAMAHCKMNLVSSMVPSIIVPLNSFPLLPNGKIDMKNLPEPEWSNFDDQSTRKYMEPKNELERTIQSVWMEVLNIDDPISMDDDFFTIGGQSMTGIRVMGILRSKNVGPVSLKLLFQNPTIREFANAIQSDDHHPSKTLRSVTFKRVPSKALKQMSSLRKTFLRLSTKNSLRRQTSKNGMISDIAGSLANLSPESLNISSYFQGEAPKAVMPYYLYMCLQIVANSFVKSLPTFLLAVFVFSCMVVKSTFGSAVLIFIAPVLFFLFVNIGMLVMMITGKKALFQSGLQPGVYPLYGSVYLRWLCGSLLQKEGFKQNFWFLRRTKVLVKLFRLLGGKIRTNVILDSPELLEPDLINIQARSSVGEGAVISPAFITPEGCLGDVPCLVFSPVYIGAACDVGLAASIHGGGNLPSDQSLKPYGCLNQSHAVIDSEQMRQKFPHFYPEEHLSDPLVYAAMCIQLLVAYLCVFPGTAACVLVCGIFDSSVPSSVRSSIIGLPCLVILYNLIIKLIVARLTARTVNYSVLKFKQLFLGKLNPGRNLVQDRMSCWLYCIFLKLIDLPFYDYYATAIPLGLTVGKHTGIKDGVREHDAVSIGSYGTSGGVTFFRCVDGNGEIGGISIESHVSCGNCAFFPGAVVQVGAQIGNETPIGANSVIGRFSQVQGDHETKSEQSSDMDLDQSKEPAVAYAVSVGLAIQKELPWEAAKTVAIDLPILSFIHSAYCLSPLLVAPACIVGTFIHSICSAIWLRQRLQYIGYYDLIQAGKSLGNTLSDHVTYQQGSLGIFKLNETLHYLIGTPWFNLFLNRLLHVKVSDKAIILTYMMPEWHLIEIGRCLLERYSIASTHSIRKGQYIFDNVEILDNAWVGCKCRLLCPKLIGHQSRVLPGSLVFPGESVHQGEVWAGVPAHCIKSNKSE